MQARRTSWPSRRMSAATSTVSPTQRLAGKRPPSTAGEGASIRIRDGAGPAFSSGARWAAFVRAGFAAAAFATAAAVERLGAGTRASFPNSPGRNVPVRLPHGSGVQLHPTSLPGGRLGPGAYEFVDWLA